MNEQEVPTATKPYKKCRRLKVCSGGTDKPKVHVPYVRLRGRWLKDAGFAIGGHVRIEVREGRLMIEQLD